MFNRRNEANEASGQRPRASRGGGGPEAWPFYLYLFYLFISINN